MAEYKLPIINISVPSSWKNRSKNTTVTYGHNFEFRVDSNVLDLSDDNIVYKTDSHGFTIR